MRLAESGILETRGHVDARRSDLATEDRKRNRP